MPDTTSARPGRSASPRRDTVLVVDDDATLLAALNRGLALRNYQVALAQDSGQALVYLQRERPDVIVLDVMMPGMDGLSLCRLIRDTDSVPILMLTARDSVADRVAGLQVGADDYLVKPFAFEELVARIEALLRRTRPQAAPREPMAYDDLTLDAKHWIVIRGEAPITLTATEFRLLQHFLRMQEQIITRDDVIFGLWGDDAPVESNVIDVHVANLRHKLEEGGRSRLIQTIRGVGYMLKREV